MDAKEVAGVLREMAVLLELTGANPFRARAFANAARSIDSLPEDLAVLLAEGRLDRVRGIGKGIVRAVHELWETDAFADLETLRASVPAGLFDLLKIPGLGPKKVRALWQDLGITSLGDLETAAREDRLREVAGFGPAAKEKTLAGIAQLRSYSGRFLCPVAMRTAEALLARLRESGAVRSVTACGELRRRTETVAGIELVAAVASGEEETALAMFAAVPEVAHLVERDDRRASVITGGGIPAELVAVREDEYAFAVCHATGSDAHGARLAEHASRVGLTLSERRLERQGQPLAAGTEEEVYAHLGLDWIPPELREDRGEIEAASAEALPELLTDTDLCGVFHVHTTASDGHASLAEMVQGARERGWDYLGVSDHSVSAFYASGLDLERIREQHREMRELARAFPGFTIFKGIESDILADGALDYDDEVLAEFDFVIASVHSRFRMPRAEMTERILTAIRHPAVAMLGHPTGRLLLTREAYAVDLEPVLAEAGRLGVAVELNANPQRLDLDWRQLPSAIAQGALIAICPDAHDVAGYDDTYLGVAAARKGWLTSENVLNCRSAEEVAEFFRARRRGWQVQPGRRSRFGARGEVLA